MKTIDVGFGSLVLGGQFVVTADTGPYAIRINPAGSHPELSLLHELGHYLEWQAIPKSRHGYRDFDGDPRFDEWMNAALASENVQRIIDLRDRHDKGSVAYRDLDYLLRPDELWARAYAQYVTRQSGQTRAAALWQQIAAENRAAKGGIIYRPYWPWGEFALIQPVMQGIFDGLGWTR